MNDKECKIDRIIESVNTMDGGGVKIKRSIGSQKISMVDPFLLLDEFSSDNPNDYIAGFPPHPHRGFETVTYIIHGKMEHEDSGGNKGVIEDGGVQWMTAGQGVIHSEMPLQENGLMKGFQLWVNLPASDKMIPPRYQNIDKKEIPVIAQDNLEIKLIAGKFEEHTGPVKGIVTDPVYMDVNIKANGEFHYNVPANHTLAAYVFEGEVEFGSTQVNKSNLVLFTEGNFIKAASKKTGRFLLFAGKPIKEPVFRAGPFVMSSQAELVQAFKDFGY